MLRSSSWKLTRWPEEFDGNQGTEISLCVQVGIEERLKATRRIVFDVAEQLAVSGTLAPTRHPDLIALVRLKLGDVIAQIFRHFFWQIVGIVEVSRLPAVDPVELQEYARSRVSVAERVLLRALIELADIEFAHLTLVRKLHKVAVLLIDRAEAVLWKVNGINQIASLANRTRLTIHKFI